MKAFLIETLFICLVVVVFTGRAHMYELGLFLVSLVLAYRLTMKHNDWNDNNRPGGRRKIKLGWSPKLSTPTINPARSFQI